MGEHHDWIQYVALFLSIMGGWIAVWRLWMAKGQEDIRRAIEEREEIKRRVNVKRDIDMVNYRIEQLEKLQ